MKKLILLFSIFISSFLVSGQLIKPAEVILQFVSGAADGTNQAIIHHHLGQDLKFWDYNTSWKNKYKNWPDDKREAYPGSKTVLVFLSDGYHLTRFVDQTSMTVCVVLAGKNEIGEKTKRSFWHYVLRYGILASINRFSFNLFYDVILKK